MSNFNFNKRLIVIFIVLAIVLAVGAVSYFSLFMRLNYPKSSVEEYYVCEYSDTIKEHGDFVISKAGVCMKANHCRILSEYVDCKNLGSKDFNGRKVAKGLTNENFDFEPIHIEEDGYGPAYFLTIDGQTIFFGEKKGNGRAFEVDRETFEYLGGDQYKDKNGIVEKNSRIN